MATGFEHETDDAGSERVSLLRDSFERVEKVLRAFGIYAEGHEVVQGFLDDLCNKLRAVTERFGETWLEVKAAAVLFGETEVYGEDPDGNRFVFGMHRDGIRRLCLLPGLTDDEIGRFVRVLGVDLDAPAHFDSDRVTLLWDAELENIRYIVAEVLGESAGEEEADLDQYRNMMNEIIAAATAARLPAGYESRLQEKLIRVATGALADIQPEQIAATLAMAEQTGGVDAFAGDEDQRWLETLRAQYTDPEAALLKFTEILFRGLARPTDEEWTPALATLDLLCQTLVQHHRRADLLDIARLGETLGQTPRFCSTGAVDRLLGCLFGEDRLQPIVIGLDQEGDRETALELLREMPPARLDDLLEQGAALTTPEGRAALVRLLAERTAEEPDRLARHLRAPTPAVGELAFRALLNLGTEAALEALTPLQHHPSPNMRLDLLRATRDCNSEAIRKARIALLRDDNGRVRAEAEQCLAHHQDPELVRWLCRRLAAGDLDSASFVEKKRVCEILGAGGGRREIKLLDELVRQGARPLQRQRTLETCAAAAFGLAATGDLAHAALLEKEGSRRLANRLVRDACRKALVRLKQAAARQTSEASAAPTDDRPAPSGAPPERATAPATPPGSRSSAEVDLLLRQFLESEVATIERQPPTPAAPADDEASPLDPASTEREQAKPEMDELLRRYLAGKE